MNILGTASHKSGNEFSDDEIHDWIRRHDVERFFDLQAARTAIDDARSMHLLAPNNPSMAHQLKGESKIADDHQEKSASCGIARHQ